MLTYDLDDPAQLDLHPAYGTPAKAVVQVPFWRRLIWEGGRPFDAFLTIVSAQVNLGAAYDLVVTVAATWCTCTLTLSAAAC